MSAIRTSWISLLLLALCGPGLSAREAELTLRDGSRLQGTVEQAGDQSFSMQSYWMGEGAVEFPLSRIQNLRFPSSEVENLSSFAVVDFKGGGRLTLLDAEEDVMFVRGRTEWGESLSLSKQQVRRVRQYTGSTLVAQMEEEPLEMDRIGREWMSPSWEFPDRFRLEIELQTPDPPFQVHLHLFERPDAMVSGRVLLELTESRASSAWFRRGVKEAMQVNSWRDQLGIEPGRWVVEILGDKQRQSMRVLINGVVLKDWNMPILPDFLEAGPSSVWYRVLSGESTGTLESVRLTKWRDAGSSWSAVSSSSPFSDGQSEEHWRVDFLRPGDHLIANHLTLTPDGFLRMNLPQIAAPLRLPFEKLRALERYPAAVYDGMGQLRLLNGDRLQGEFSGMEEERVRMRVKELNSLLEVKGRYVERLQLAPAIAESFLPPWNIQLTNGDWISAAEISREGAELEVLTEWGDRISLHESHLISVNLRKQQPVLTGPGDPEQWIFTDNMDRSVEHRSRYLRKDEDGWHVRDNLNLQRVLPEVDEAFSLVMDLELTREQGANWLMISGIPDRRQNRGRTVQVIHRSGEWTTQRSDRLRGQRQARPPRRLSSTPGAVRLKLRYSADTRHLQIWVNGQILADEVVEEWDSQPGAFIPLMSLGSQYGGLTLRSFQFYDQWEGFSEPQEPTGSRGRLVLSNADRMEADWVGMDSSTGEWQVRLPDGDRKLSLPRDRVVSWLAPAVERRQPRRRSGDVQVNLLGGGRLTGEWISFSSRTLTLRREGIPENLDIPVPWIQSVHFQPHLALP